MVVAHILREAGMDVVYLGNLTPEQIIDTAIDEDVDLVGVSSLGGAHLTLGREVIALAERYGLLGTKIFIMGGVIPPRDEKELLAIGFHAIFGPGSTQKEILDRVTALFAENEQGTDINRPA